MHVLEREVFDWDDRWLVASSEHDVIHRSDGLKQYLDICFDLRATQVTDVARDPTFGGRIVSEDTFEGFLDMRFLGRRDDDCSVMLDACFGECKLETENYRLR